MNYNKDASPRSSDPEDAPCPNRLEISDETTESLANLVNPTIELFFQCGDSASKD